MRIGIDLGGTNIGIGLLDDNLNIIYKKEFQTEKEKGYDYVKLKMMEEIEKVISRANKNNIHFIGLGIPGIEDKKGNIYCTNLNWHKLPLRKDLENRFKIPAYIENDATVAGIAEATVGASKAYKNSIFITLGTGIGGGIIVDNKIYTGSHGIGTEIGHMIVGENFYDCSCGNNGCLETFSSATALEKFVEMKKTSGEKLTTKDIFNLAQDGDELCLMAVDRMIKYLSIGIGNLINIMDPDIIILGGGISKAGDFLLNKINNLYPRYILFKSIGFAEIKLSTLGNDAGIIGAAMLKEYK